MKSFERIVELFMNLNDKEALEELYKVTQDDIVKILLNWKKEYEVELQCCDSCQSSMYEDIMEYVWKKYNLCEVSSDKDNDISF